MAPCAGLGRAGTQGAGSANSGAEAEMAGGRGNGRAGGHDRGRARRTRRGRRGDAPGRVDFPTHCPAPQEAGLPPADGPTTARIAVDNPAPQVGDTVTVTYQVLRTPAVNPVGGELPADSLTPTGRILLAGAQSGEVTVVGAKRNDPVPAGAALPAVTMTGTFTVTAPGETTLAPGGYTLHTSHGLDLDTTCTADAGSAAPSPPA